MDERDKGVITVILKPKGSKMATLWIRPERTEVRKVYLELDVELVVWDRVPMPVELGI